ncbi:MAG TPA: hypothetical protein VOA87_23125 [Thermoanaerobaculia bacterium]|nr:hypothetical protein [Thermoanaerobaculia bacterium]
MSNVRLFMASVTYTRGGETREDAFPVRAGDFASAKDMALSYILQVFRLRDFELRIVGA